MVTMRPARRSVGAIGLGLTAVGEALLVLSFTTLDWYSDAGSGNALTFGTLRDLTDTIRGPGVTRAYFGWLAWVLLALAGVVAVLANLPATSGRRVGVAGAAIGVAGAVLTYLALWRFFSTLRDAGAGDVGAFTHAAAGVYVALGGFLVTALGAAAGARR
jgi:hypothetical protein